MLLQNKIAVIYGGGGAIGASVAIAFSEAGATVCLAGRSLAALKITSGKIIAAGGKVEIAEIDALNKKAVENHLADIAGRYGSIDISFNAIGTNDVQGNALCDMNVSDFISPVVTAMQSYFITATAACSHMRLKKSGVILAITANAAKRPYENSGGFGVSCAAIEGFCRQLAMEEGRHGIRVVCMRSAGSPDAPGVDDVFNTHAENAGISREDFEKEFAERTMLKRLPRLAEIANTAVLVASDKASAITAAVINITCGELAD